jgi:hypothetical protein
VSAFDDGFLLGLKLAQTQAAIEALRGKTVRIDIELPRDDAEGADTT